MALRPTTFDRSLGFILGDISRLARREFDRRVRGLQLTRSQWLFLYHLARQPGCTQSELAESLQMERISVSRQAGRLEKAGWIERRDHRRDGRAYHLHLTPKAERLTPAPEQPRRPVARGLPERAPRPAAGGAGPRSVARQSQPPPDGGESPPLPR